MTILALGLNHKTAPVEIRERLTFGPDIIVGALRNLSEHPAVDEAVILSTCNRTELYCTIDDDAQASVADWISDFHGLEQGRVSPYLYSHLGDAAVQHLLRVSCGLDSLVLGEPQILGQVKSAFQTANASGTTRKLLCRLFQHAFSVAKQIRTDTAIGNSPVSVAFAAVSLAKQIFSDLSEQTALLIGAGETIELAARHLHQNGIGHMIVANRTVEKAHNLAAQFEGYAIALTELSGHLAEADIVISSTASPLPVLGKGTVESALKERKHRPIFMVDIAVPRDIEPEVSDLSDIYLYTVDDLDEVIQENMRSRQEAAEQAEEIIERYVDEFIGWLRSLDAVELIQDYRNQGELLRDEVLKKALQQLNKGKSPEEALQFLARTLTNKLLHTPSSQLRQAGFDGQTELLEAANTLFQLKQLDSTS
ncbi:MAG: glutamyl-tRNA reductase [gamma proteobacterium endosymbiont of Lamellibrachia anaximandri]|nr:glutamyl-tRNA reductase [gamma proteobacterium endosymbiont of Lamellibrachia anaximandri]MBL3616170.1 glutamyl-tRNA reductase [gamma proteobacterium endosymbiont of Lamellibrachia anaximandri]